MPAVPPRIGTITRPPPRHLMKRRPLRKAALISVGVQETSGVAANRPECWASTVPNSLPPSDALRPRRRSRAKLYVPQAYHARKALSIALSGGRREAVGARRNGFRAHHTAVYPRPCISHGYVVTNWHASRV